MFTNLKEVAEKLPSPWKSIAVATVSNANIKVLCMDERAYEAEAHEYAEALIVLEGCMNLSISDETVVVRSGEMYLVPAGVRHGIAVGSHGTLLILDPYIDANVRQGSGSGAFFDLAASIPKSEPARTDEPARRPFIIGPDGLPQSTLPSVITDEEIRKMQER